jgi:hypothetical protein
MVLGATDRLSCIVSLSKFYSSGDPRFLGDSPSPVFIAVLEKSHVRHGANRRRLQSNSIMTYAEAELQTFLSCNIDMRLDFLCA